MKIIENKIEDVLNYTNLEVPFYQREYVWDKKNITKLLNDFFKNNNEEYYLGSLILKQDQLLDTKTIVDGQQRLTTIWLIQRCIYDVFNNNEEFFKNTCEDYEFLSVILNGIGEKISKFKFFSSNYDQGESLVNLVKNGIEDGRILKVKSSKDRYFSAYEIVYGYINERKKDLKEFIKKFRRIIFGEIRLNDKEDEHIIYQQINSTGKRLTIFDLVKNYLFSNIFKKIGKTNFDSKLDIFNSLFDEAKRVDGKLNDDRRDELVRFFLSYKFHNPIPSNGDIYDKFLELDEKEYVKDYNRLYDDLCKFIFLYIFAKEKYKEKKYAFNVCLEFLSKNFNTYITLIIDIFWKIINPNNIFFQKGYIEISSKEETEIFKAFKVLEIYIIRKVFSSKPLKNDNMYIPQLVKEINVNLCNDNKYSDVLYTIIFNRSESVIENGSSLWTMPNIAQFENGLKTTNIYSNNSNFCKNFLIRLSKNINDSLINFKSYSVEHVLPQNQDKWREEGLLEDSSADIEQYINTIGNLTITPYNSNYSNSIFSKKKEIMFEKEGFVLNNYFQRLEKWNVGEIKKRSNLIFENVCQYWNFDEYKRINTINNAKDQINEAECSNLINSIDVYQINKKDFIDNKIYPIIQNYYVEGRSPNYIDKEILGVDDSNGEISSLLIKTLDITVNSGSINKTKITNFFKENKTKIDKIIYLLSNSDD